MPLTPSRWKLWGRMLLPLAVAGAFFGPSIAAFATSRPVVAVGVAPPPPIPVISVHPFLSLSHDSSCIEGPPVHVGPTHRTAVLFYEQSLRERMNGAAAECAGPSGYLVLSVAVDKGARITNVRADAGPDSAVASCATTFMRRSQDLETRGPGTLEIGYF